MLTDNNRITSYRNLDQSDKNCMFYNTLNNVFLVSSMSMNQKSDQ